MAGSELTVLEVVVAVTVLEVVVAVTVLEVVVAVTVLEVVMAVTVTVLEVVVAVGVAVVTSEVIGVVSGVLMIGGVGEDELPSSIALTLCFFFWRANTYDRYNMVYTYIQVYS